METPTVSSSILTALEILCLTLRNILYVLHYLAVFALYLEVNGEAGYTSGDTSYGSANK